MKYFFILFNLNGFKDGNDYQKLYKELNNIDNPFGEYKTTMYHLADESWILKTDNKYATVNNIKNRLLNVLSKDDELFLFEVTNLDFANIYSNNKELIKWLMITK